MTGPVFGVIPLSSSLKKPADERTSISKYLTPFPLQMKTGSLRQWYSISAYGSKTSGQSKREYKYKKIQLDSLNKPQSIPLKMTRFRVELSPGTPIFELRNASPPRVPDRISFLGTRAFPHSRPVHHFAIGGHTSFAASSAASSFFSFRSSIPNLIQLNSAGAVQPEDSRAAGPVVRNAD